MNKKHAFLIACLIGISICSYQWIFKRSARGMPLQKTSHVKSKQGAYFLSIPIFKFTSSNLPCISIEVNHQTVSAMLDLGFRGQFSFSSQLINSIEDKKYLRTEKMHGIRGGTYEHKVYQVPEVQIGPMFFPQPELHEYAEKFQEEATFTKEGRSPSSGEPAKIGWELFGNTNLFLDFPNSKIAFCDSIETLKTQGYAVERFTKIPLFLNRGLIEFCAETQIGKLLCMLDTGSTWNLLNSDATEAKLLDQIMWEPENITNLASFKINERDFGPVSFHRLPLKLPIHIEAILGVEFFGKHLVFLDFSENFAYFQKL